jgi:hypothetical protein
MSTRKNKSQKYPSPEVYDHVSHKKKVNKFTFNRIPEDIWYLAITLIALMVAFVALITQ